MPRRSRKSSGGMGRKNSRKGKMEKNQSTYHDIDKGGMGKMDKGSLF